MAIKPQHSSKKHRHSLLLGLRRSLLPSKVNILGYLNFNSKKNLIRCQIIEIKGFSPEQY